jgi:hypothetical protein
LEVYVGAVLAPIFFVDCVAFPGVDVGGHALLVEGRWFFEVAEVEGEGVGVLTVFYGEVVPTGVSLGVGVDSEEEIELVWGDFDGAVEVGGLEGAVEEVLILGFEGGVHAFEGPVEEGGVRLLRSLSLSSRSYRCEVGCGYFAQI